MLFGQGIGHFRPVAFLAVFFQVLHNQAGDLHPPLFGLALNAASSLAPGTWSC